MWEKQNTRNAMKSTQLRDVMPAEKTRYYSVNRDKLTGCAAWADVMGDTLHTGVYLNCK